MACNVYSPPDVKSVLYRPGAETAANMTYTLLAATVTEQ